MKTTANLLAGALLLGAFPAHATSIMNNAGFETALGTAIPGWTTTLSGGSAKVVTSFDSYVSDGGYYYSANMSDSNPAGVPYTDPNAVSSGVTYTAPQGSNFLVVGAGDANLRQSVSQTMALVAGDTLNVWAAFDWGDYKYQDPVTGEWTYDGASAELFSGSTLVHTFLNTDGSGKPDFYDGAWNQSSYTLSAAGNYTLVFAAINTFDDMNPSFGLFDTTLTAYQAPPPDPPAPAGPSVPEPATLALLGLGLIGLGMVRR